MSVPEKNGDIQPLLCKARQCHIATLPCFAVGVGEFLFIFISNEKTHGERKLREKGGVAEFAFCNTPLSSCFCWELLVEVSLQQALKRLAVASFVAGHLVNHFAALVIARCCDSGLRSLPLFAHCANSIQKDI